MNEQSLNATQNVASPSTQGPSLSVKKPVMLDKIMQKIPQKIKDPLIKFYANKKIFWPVAGAAGAILLIVILGLLFGKRSLNQATGKPKPTPVQNQVENQASPSPDQLSQIQIDLGKIRNLITGLDVRQAPLQPPAIDFKISF